MSELFRTRITAVWILLVGATLFSWTVGHGLGFSDARMAGSAILVVTFAKVRFVMLDFMEMRHAPRGLRIAAEAWVVAIAIVLLVLFLHRA